MPLKINYLLSAEQELVLPVSHGEWVHRLFFRLLEKKAPTLGRQLHADCSPAPFSLHLLRGLVRRRRHVILPRGREAIFTVSLLSKEIEEFFLSLKEAEITLDGKSFHLQEAGAYQRSYAELLRSSTQVHFRFRSPTTFRRFGRNYPLPAPEYVFSGLLKKWNRFASKGQHFPEDLSEKFLREVLVSRYQGKTYMVEFGQYRLVGFKGEAWFRTSANDLTEVVGSLSALASFAGVGYKTTMGLGQVETSFPEK